MNNLESPSFLGIGPYKTATTWMHTYLEKHPDILLPVKKEINYFSFNYDNGWDWYLSHYHNQPQDIKCVGDISPSYFSHDQAPQRIAKMLPGAKLIIILRNPVDRAYSHYCMDLRLGKASDDIESEIFQFIEDGLYFKHISRYLSFIPRSRLCVVLFDDLKKNPATFLKNLYESLGVDSGFHPPSLQSRVYAKKTLPKFTSTYQKSYRTFRDAQRQKSNPIIPVKLKEWIIDNLHELMPKGEYPEFSHLLRREVAVQYRQDVEELSNWLGKNCNDWLERYL